MGKKGSELVAESLVATGIDTVFSIVSIHNMELHDALLLKKSEIHYIGGRTETGLGFMADGFARATGNIGVYITSSGPGAMYSMPAMGEAYYGCSPVLQITTNVAREFIDTGKLVTHQTRNQLEMFRSISGYTAKVDETKLIPIEMQRAIAWLKNNRPRSAVIEIPHDIFRDFCDEYVPVDRDEIEGFGLKEDNNNEEELGKIVEMVSKSKRPLIWLGEELHYYSNLDDLLSLVEMFECPVVSGEGAKGVFPEDHPLCLGPAVGNRNWGDNPLIDFINRCDLVIVIGACLPYRSTVDLGIEMPENLIHITQDENLFDLNYKARIKLKSRGDRVIKELAVRLKSIQLQIDKNYSKEAKVLKNNIYESVKNSWKSALRMFEAVREIMPDDSISCWDITIPLFGAVRGYKVNTPNSFFYAHGWFGLGFGLPASIGAKLGCPQKKVVCFAGDGGFQYTMQELGTAVQYGISPIVVIFNDNSWGLLKRYQKNRYSGKYLGTELINPDFHKLGQAYGLESIRVNSLKDMCIALSTALNSQNVSLIEVNLPDGIESFV
jgi:acetolactate synthase I/II/III large subunit